MVTTGLFLDRSSTTYWTYMEVNRVGRTKHTSLTWAELPPMLADHTVQVGGGTCVASVVGTT